MTPAPPGQRQDGAVRRHHGVLARHGWLWLAGPGAVLVLMGLGVAGAAAPADPARTTGLQTAAAFVALLGALVLVVGLPVRAALVRRHAPQREHLPSLGGRYRGAAPAQPRPLVAVALLAGAVALLTQVLLIGLAAYGGERAVRIQLLRHSSHRRYVAAVLERPTDVRRGRGTTYTDTVDYTVGGHGETGVPVSDDRALPAGATRLVLVDPAHPRFAITPEDRGVGDVLLGGIPLLLLGFEAVLLVRSRRHHRAAAAAPTPVGS